MNPYIVVVNDVDNSLIMSGGRNADAVEAVISDSIRLGIRLRAFDMLFHLLHDLCICVVEYILYFARAL